VGDGGVSKAITAAQGVEGGAGEAEVRWLPELLLDLAVFDVPDGGGAGEGDFVEAVRAVDEALAALAEEGEGLGHFVADAFGRDADQLCLGAGGVAERAHEIKNGTDFQLRANGGGVEERGMEFGGEEESDAGFANACAHFFGGEIDVDTEGFEDIGAAAHGTSGAITVFGDLDAGAGDDEGGDGRYVEGVGFIAAGATGVEGGAGTGIDGEHGFAHGAGEAVEHLGFDFARGQEDQEGGELNGGDRAGEDEAHGLAGVIGLERFFANQKMDERQHDVKL